jgi:hypothetical protein
VSSPFRRPAVETLLVVPSAEATRLLLELAREGWRRGRGLAPRGPSPRRLTSPVAWRPGGMIEASESNGRVFLRLRHPAPHRVEITPTEALRLAHQQLALAAVRKEEGSETAPLREMMASLFPKGDDPTLAPTDLPPRRGGGTVPLPTSRKR